MNLKQYLDEIVKFLQDEVKKANAKGLIVGLSGGVDSAVAALLMQKAFPNNHLVLLMPCLSPKIDLDYANNLVNKHKLTAKLVNLDDVFLTFKRNLPLNLPEIKQRTVLGNAKARLRMSTLYAYGQSYNYLVIGTGNADEWYTGYFTKYGDSGADLLPLVNLLKQDIFQAAKMLNVTKEIIDRKPTASLWEGQTDEADLGFTYQKLDQFLLGNSSQLSEPEKTKITTMHHQT
ncbi:MAG: NAD(+) synthase, partial [Spiroplasma sp.]|nr:NAD(+) synthase [Spiroplasma sp.]